MLLNPTSKGASKDSALVNPNSKEYEASDRINGLFGEEKENIGFVLNT